MFGKDMAKINSLVGSQSELQGEFVVRGTLRMDGVVTGKLQAERVILSETAIIRGDILAKRIIVGGSVEGTIRAPELVEIRSKGKVRGDIFTNKLSISEGAEFNGRIEMGAEESCASELSSHGARVDRPETAPIVMAINIDMGCTGRSGG